MDKRKIKEFSFYFKQDSVIMSYREQYVCFNSFNIRNKRNLNNFAIGIRNARSMDLGSVFLLAKVNNVPSMNLTDGSVIKNIKRIN